MSSLELFRLQSRHSENMNHFRVDCTLLPTYTTTNGEARERGHKQSGKRGLIHSRNIRLSTGSD